MKESKASHTGKKIGRSKTDMESLQLKERSLERAIGVQKKKVEKRYREERGKFLKLFFLLLVVFFIASVFLTYLWPQGVDALGILSKDARNALFDSIEENFILYVLGLTAVFMIVFSWIYKSVCKKNHEELGYVEEDVLEMLEERLRVNRLEQKALSEGRLLEENEKKIYLSYYDKQEKICSNCAYCGESITKTTYSDGSTDTSHNYYFCSRNEDREVSGGSTCSFFYPKRVVVASEEADSV